MAHFYGSVQGSGEKTSRLGTKRSGMRTTAVSHEGCVCVEVLYNEKEGCDWVYVSLDRLEGTGQLVPLYDGPIGGMDAEQYLREAVLKRINGHS